MAKPSPRRSLEPSGEGWDALRAADWEAARELFGLSLEAGETPEALEGLSWAAWWLDDADAVFESRERAYRLYRERGDAADAARMATWLAVDHSEFRGADAVASGWLARAHRLLQPLEPGPDHGWLAFHEGYFRHAEGDTAAARELAATAIELGRRFEVVDLQMLGLALDGAALVASGRVQDGMRCLDEATAAALADEASIPIANAWTFCILVTSCTTVYDYARAIEWSDRIAEFAQRYGSRYMLAFCRAHYGAVHLWRGRWADAEAELGAAADDFASSRPAWAPLPLLELAELRRRQGRPSEAALILTEAGPVAGGGLGRARLALDRGDSLRAVDLLERLLRQLPADRLLDRAPALELLVLARVARGALDDAARALEALRAAERLYGTVPLRAAADAAEGALAAARGDHDGARTLLEDAVDGYERCGAPYEAALARIALATSMIASGRREAAADEATAAWSSLADLGAPVEAERARQLLDAEPPMPLDELTPREREVLDLVADGLTNRAIAARLVVSEHTVHRHVTNILRKLEVSSRTAAAALAVRAGRREQPDA